MVKPELISVLQTTVWVTPTLIFLLPDAIFNLLLLSVNYSEHLFLFPELYYDRGNHHEFTSLVKELARPGELTQSTNYSYEFLNVEKPYESYTGANVRLR